MTTTPRTRADELIGSSAGQWTLDPSGSSVSLTQSTLWGLMKVKGRFSELRGGGRVHPDGSVSGDLAVAVASIDTRNKKRDEHLRSDDFLRAAAHPDIVFEAGSAHPSGSGLTLEGTLSVAGVTLPIQVPVVVDDSDADAVTLRSEVSIDRTDYGMKSNQLGMIRGRAAVQVTARFVRSADVA